MKFYRIFKVSFLSKIQTRFINSDRNKFDRTKFKFNWRAEFLIFKFRYQFNSISGISCVVYGYLDWQLQLDTLKIMFQSITNMNRSTFWRFKIYFNSQAVGWDSWVPSALKSIFWGVPIFESAAWFFVIILKFTFTLIFEIQIHEKNFPDTNKNFEGRFLYSDTIYYNRAPLNIL